MIEPNKVRTRDGHTQHLVATHPDTSPELVRKGVPWKPWIEWFTVNADAVGISLLLLTLFVALFHRVLYFQPANPDDLRFISQIATTPNPLKYLFGDWGEGPYVTGEYGMYRPIHPISLWLVYKVFDVLAEPNQWINLILHFANVLVLLMILLRVQKNRVVALLCTALFMVSNYTVSPAIWVTDRATLQVGLALLLLIYHTVKTNETNAPLRISYVLILCSLALLSKESGLIVPLFALLVSLHRSPTTIDKIRRGAVYGSVIGVYFLARFLMFGSQATAYTNKGYLFGMIRYDKINDLPEHLRILSLIDNSAKSVLAVIVPVFSELGQLDLGMKVLVAAIATITLVAISIKKLTFLQMYCLGIIILNAAIHYQIYRHRALYITQIAFCLFVAAGPVIEAGTRRWATFAIASVVLLLVSLVQVDSYIQAQYVWRYKELQIRSLEEALKVYPGRIDPEVARRVLQRYQ